MNHIEWSYAGSNVEGFEQILKSYNSSEFKSPFRSTVPLLSFWKNPFIRLEEFTDALVFSLPNSLQMDFEHEVPVQNGKGRASCTDLLIIFDKVSIAIEAKSTEPRYQDVAEWLGKPESKNKMKVLEGWLGLISTFGTKIEINEVLDLPYQLIHHAASACSLDVNTQWLVYQLFNVSEKKLQVYLSDLKQLASILGDDSQLNISISEITLRPTDYKIELDEKWNSGERDLSKQVIEGLNQERLFNVSEVNFIKLKA